MTGEVNNDVKIGGLAASIPAKIEAGKKMAELRTKAIEINKQLNDVIGKLPAEVQDAYYAYKRLDNAEEKLEEIYHAAGADYVVCPITEKAIRENRGLI